MAFCAKCGTQLSAGAGFCSSCGAAVGQAATPVPGAAGGQVTPASAGLTNNVAGMLCYIAGFITGIVFLVIEPYRNNRFIRFHAFQSIFYSFACIVIWMIWTFLVVGLFFSGGGGLGLLGLLGMLFWALRVAMLVGWILLMVKAYNNEEFKLPFVGDLAAQQAG